MPLFPKHSECAASDGAKYVPGYSHPQDLTGKIMIVYDRYGRRLTGIFLQEKADDRGKVLFSFFDLKRNKQVELPKESLKISTFQSRDANLPVVGRSSSVTDKKGKTRKGIYLGENEQTLFFYDTLQKQFLNLRKSSLDQEKFRLLGKVSTPHPDTKAVVAEICDAIQKVGELGAKTSCAVEGTLPLPPAPDESKEIEIAEKAAAEEQQRVEEERRILIDELWHLKEKELKYHFGEKRFEERKERWFREFLQGYQRLPVPELTRRLTIMKDSWEKTSSRSPQDRELEQKARFNQPDPKLPGADLTRDQLLAELWKKVEPNLVSKYSLNLALESNRAAAREYRGFAKRARATPDWKRDRLLRASRRSRNAEASPDGDLQARDRDQKINADHAVELDTELKKMLSVPGVTEEQLKGEIQLLWADDQNMKSFKDLQLDLLDKSKHPGPKHNPN